MAMEIYTFSNQYLSSGNLVQSWIDRSGFELAISGGRDWAAASGYVSAIWKGREAGFECGPARLADLEEAYSLDFGGPWTQILGFRFSTLAGCAGALIVGAVYAHATEGVLFEPDEVKFFRSSEAIARARKCEAVVMQMEELQARILNAPRSR